MRVVARTLTLYVFFIVFVICQLFPHDNQIIIIQHVDSQISYR